MLSMKLHAEDEAMSAYHLMMNVTHDTASYGGWKGQTDVVLVCPTVWASSILLPILS